MNNWRNTQQAAVLRAAAQPAPPAKPTPPTHRVPSFPYYRVSAPSGNSVLLQQREKQRKEWQLQLKQRQQLQHHQAAKAKAKAKLTAAAQVKNTNTVKKTLVTRPPPVTSVTPPAPPVPAHSAVSPPPATSSPVPASPTPPAPRKIVDENKSRCGDVTFYWINLARSTHRRERLEREFAAHGVRNIRVEAVDGDNSDELRSLLHAPDKLKSLAKHKYEVATTVSHLRAVHAFVTGGGGGAPYGVICEDDLSFEYESKWKHSLPEFIAKAPKDWSVLQLSLTINVPNELQRISVANKTFQLRRGVWYSGLCYVITRPFALRLLKEHGIPCAVGSTFHSKVKLAASLLHCQSERVVIGTGTGRYTVFPPLFTYPDDNDSSIHPQHLGMHTRSKQLIKEAAWGKK